MSQTSHVFFDLDGTITDSKQGILNCLVHALKKMGAAPPPQEEMEQYFGPPLWDNFRKLLQTDDKNVVDRAVGFFRERYLHERMGIIETSLYPDIVDVLDEMRRYGKTLYIATSKATDVSNEVLKHFNCLHYFKDVCGAFEDGTRSAKHEVIGHLLKAHDIDPKQVIMVGDRHHDIAGANFHAMRSVGVLWGYGSTEELKKAGATSLAVKPRDLLALVL